MDSGDVRRLDAPTSADHGSGGGASAGLFRSRTAEGILMRRAELRVAAVFLAVLPGEPVHTTDLRRSAHVRAAVLYRLLHAWQERGWLDTGLAGHRWFRLTDNGRDALVKAVRHDRWGQ